MKTAGREPGCPFDGPAKPGQPGARSAQELEDLLLVLRDAYVGWGYAELSGQ